jgi:hypothetical protein
VADIAALPGDESRERFARARRSGYPAWLWPDVPVDKWRSAVDSIATVARGVLMGECKPVLLCTDLNAMAVAAYTSGMGPLLGYWLENDTVSAESEVAELFRLHLSHNRRRMDRLSGVAREIVGKLSQANISPLILKGMHTAFRYFPKPGTRPLSDIDMYVPMESMEPAERIFAEAGFRRAPRMRSPYACDWIMPSVPQSPRTLTFVHEDDPWSLDVLGSLDKQLSTGARIRFAKLLPCSEPADGLPSSRACVMRQPLLALYLAAHISQTLLNVTVLRLFELALIIRRDSAEGKLDWRGFLQGASAMGGARFVYPALVFAAQLAPDTIPDDVMAAAAADAPKHLRNVIGRLTVSSAQPLDRHSVNERFMWAASGREGAKQIAGELFIDRRGRPFGQALYSIGTKLWALGRGRYSP